MVKLASKPSLACMKYIIRKGFKWRIDLNAFSPWFPVVNDKQKHLMFFFHAAFILFLSLNIKKLQSVKYMLN